MKATKNPSPRAPRTFGAADVFTLKDVCRLVGAQRPQIEYWTRLGLVVPELNAAAGTGKHRVFGLLNLVELAIAAQFNRFGISTTVTGNAVSVFRLFHETARALYIHRTDAQVEAIWRVGRAMMDAPADDPAVFHWTDAQRAAYHEALIDGFLRRDRLAGKRVGTRSAYAKHVHAQAAIFDATLQRADLIRASEWRTFCANEESRRAASESGAFFGVVAFPGDQTAVIADRSMNLRDLIGETAVIVTLERVLNGLEAQLEAWGLLDDLFRA